MNINTKTNIAFGYISAHALDDDLVHDLLYVHGTDLSYQQARQDAAHDLDLDVDVDDLPDGWDDHLQIDEPVIEGTLDGVHYCTSWLGGALNFWIFESPHVTDKARRASPCVPNAGILDVLDGSETSYDVPPNWRAK